MCKKDNLINVFNSTITIMVGSEDIRYQYEICLELIGQAQSYEKEGLEAQAIASYIRAGVEASRGRLFDNPELNVFPQINAGLEGRMENIWKGYELNINSEFDKNLPGRGSGLPLDKPT